MNKSYCLICVQSSLRPCTLKMSLLRCTVFLVIISLAYCLNSKCASYENCLQDIKKTNETFSTTVLNYWGKRLDLDDAITGKLKTSVGFLNEDISNGPSVCSKKLLPVNRISEYSTNVQNACFGESYDARLPKDVEDYFSGRYVGSMDRLCEGYVKYLNGNCGYLARGIEMIENCNIEKVFNELYRKPWELCVKDNNLK